MSWPPQVLAVGMHLCWALFVGQSFQLESVCVIDSGGILHSLSICESVCLSLRLSLCLSVTLSACLSICQPACLCLCEGVSVLMACYMHTTALICAVCLMQV